jgi:hypothetical protein
MRLARNLAIFAIVIYCMVRLELRERWPAT